MPFRQPYAQGYQDGDLIFGLHGDPGRDGFLGQFQHQITDPRRKTTISIADEFTTADLNTKADRKALTHFLSEIERHPRYGRYRRAIRPYQDDEAWWENATVNSLPEGEYQAAIRAKVKFGLEHQIRTGRGHVHFVLDGLDMFRVATKSHSLDIPRGKPATRQQALNKERGFTGSELRWIYRHRNDPRVANAVQFWLTDSTGRMRPARPPWEEGRVWTASTGAPRMTWQQAWQRYRPTIDNRRL